MQFSHAHGTQGKVLEEFSTKRPLRESEEESFSEGVVSFHAELPMALRDAMTGFIEKYPNWDQYRLIQAALAGFLVQNGIESRSITRLYINNMFRFDSLVNSIE